MCGAFNSLSEPLLGSESSSRKNEVKFIFPANFTIFKSSVLHRLEFFKRNPTQRDLIDRWEPFVTYGKVKIRIDELFGH